MACRDRAWSARYRFLDKRFYHGKHLEFELKALCYEHIGLSRNLLVADLKRKLLRAIAELEEKGFLTNMPKEERLRIKSSRWTTFSACAR